MRHTHTCIFCGNLVFLEKELKPPQTAGKTWKVIKGLE